MPETLNTGTLTPESGACRVPMARSPLDLDDLLSARSTPAGGIVELRTGALSQELKDLRDQLQSVKHELDQERGARVSAEACAKAIMQDSLLLRHQAVEAQRSLFQVDHEWRTAIGALEMHLSDRGFEGFGHERKQMAAHIDKLSSTLEEQEMKNNRLARQVEELQASLSDCQNELERQKQNARRLASITAERVAKEEQLQRFAILDSRPSVCETAKDDDIKKLGEENERLKSYIRDMQKVESVQQWRTTAEIAKASNNSKEMVRLAEEIVALEEALRNESKRVIDLQHENEQNVKNFEARVANALQERDTQMIISQALRTQVAVMEGEMGGGMEQGLSSVMSVAELIASTLVSSEACILNLKRNYEELELRTANADAESKQLSQQSQTLVHQLRLQYLQLEKDKNSHISQLQKELVCANETISKQSAEFQDFKERTTAGTQKHESLQEATDWCVETLMKSAETLDIAVCRLRSSFMEMKTQAADFQHKLATIRNQHQEERTKLKDEQEMLSQSLEIASNHWKGKYEREQEACGRVKRDLQALMSQHEVALDKLTMVSTTDQQRAIEAMILQTGLTESLHNISSTEQALAAVAQHAAIATEISSQQVISMKATYKQEISGLQGKLKEAMLVVEAADVFRSNLQSQSSRLSLEHQAAQEKVRVLEARSYCLESEVEECSSFASLLEPFLENLLDGAETTQSTLKTLMAYSLSATSAVQACQVKGGAQALKQLQAQHERLLAELEGREALIAMMEQQQLDLHAQVLHLERLNRELSFALQGHTIVQEIEHKHLQQALNKAHHAAHFVVEAKAQQTSFQRYHEQCVQQAADTQDRITYIENSVSKVSQDLEKTLMSVEDLLRDRNVMYHARKHMFAPKVEGSGVELSKVMAKNVCFLVENAGVPLLARANAVTEELVIFFAEQFDSWMQEIMHLTCHKQEMAGAINTLHDQLLLSQERIRELELGDKSSRQDTSAAFDGRQNESWLVSAPQPSVPSERITYEEVLARCEQLQAQNDELRDENTRFKLDIELCTPYTSMLNANDQSKEIEELQKMLADYVKKNKRLLDEVEMLCAMKEAADTEVQRMQDKLSLFVDRVQHSSKGATSFPRSFCPNARPRAGPSNIDDDSDSD